MQAIAAFGSSGWHRRFALIRVRGISSPWQKSRQAECLPHLRRKLLRFAMVAQAVSPALPILDDFCHGLLGPVRWIRPRLFGRTTLPAMSNHRQAGAKRTTRD